MSDLSSAAEEEAARIARELPWTVSQVLFFGIRARAIGCLDVEAFLGRCNERGIFPDAALQHLEELDDLSWPGPRRPLDRHFRAVLRRRPSGAWVVAGIGLMLGAPASAALLMTSGDAGFWHLVALYLAFAAGGLIVYWEARGR